jgi:integrase
MGSIAKLMGDDGKLKGYRARWRTPDGGSRSQTFPRKIDAEHHLTDMENGKLSGSYIDPSAGKMTFGTWAPIWRSTAVASLRPSSLARDDGYVERYLIPTFGPMRLSAIDFTAVATWMAALTTTGPKPWNDKPTRPLSPATAVKAGQTLGKILTAAVRAGKIAANPVTGVDKPTVEREEMRFLSPVEVAKLADAIDPRYRALVILGAYGGLRIGEMLGLRAGRVDLLRGQVDVAEILTEVSGTLHTGPPKTKAGRRRVPLPNIAVDALTTHLSRYPAEANAYIFRTPSGTPVRLQNWRNRIWTPAVKACDTGHVRPHDLRHTAVAFWIEAGASPVAVKVRAGHTSVVTVLDRYGHLFPESDDRINEGLDRLAGAGAG